MIDPNIELAKRYQKAITSLFKDTLRIVEDMKADHDFHYTKLYENIPSEYHPILNSANHFDERKLKWIRKKILDSGNDALRNFQQELENFTVSFIFK